jgi:hypothetical protein
MTTPVVLYNIRKSIDSNLLGLDSTETTVPLGGYTPYLMGKDLRGLRLFPIGKTGLQGNDYKISAPIIHNEFFDDFLGRVLDANKWLALTGSDGANSPVINLQNGGVVRLTTGSGSTHTMAVNGSQFVSSRNFLVSNGGLRAEFRLGKISALTSQSICFGFTDAITLAAPFTRTTVTTTATATNAACFLQDAASTNTKLYAVAVNAGGTAQSVALNLDVDTAALHTYRIEIDKLGNATYFVDGVLVATILLAVATTFSACSTVGMFSEATSGPQTLDVDYVLLQQTRV